MWTYLYVFTSTPTLMLCRLCPIKTSSLIFLWFFLDWGMEGFWMGGANFGCSCANFRCSCSTFRDGGANFGRGGATFGCRCSTFKDGCANLHMCDFRWFGCDFWISCANLPIVGANSVDWGALFTLRGATPSFFQPRAGVLGWTQKSVGGGTSSGRGGRDVGLWMHGFSIPLAVRWKFDFLHILLFVYPKK